MNSSAAAGAKLPQSPTVRFLLSEILSHWTMLTETETEPCIEDQKKLSELLQARYGWARTRADRELELFLAEFKERLRQTA